MRIGAAGDDAQAAIAQHGREHPRILEYPLLIDLELVRQCFLERDGLGGDHVHQRPSLQTGKHGGVDQLLVLDIGEDQPAARAAKRLVRRAGHEMGDADRARIEPRGDESRVVRHVGHEVRADGIGDGAEAFPIDDARVRRGPGDDELRLVLVREPLGGVVVDQLGRRIQPVGDHLEPLAGQVDRRAVRQVPAVRQRHPEEGVARLERREEHGLVGLRARVRLDVGELGVEQLLGPVDGEPLGHIHVFAAAVIALSGIAFGVLVGELRTLCGQHRAAGVVLRSDQLDVRLLTRVLIGDGGPQLRVGLGECR